MYDAPVGWTNPRARLALVGVTPGFTQMEILYRETRRHLLAGETPEEACRRAKYQATFGGAMRRNLVRMLDELGLPELLGIDSAADLFEGAIGLLHTTSVVRYPTFVGVKNYTGSKPPLIQSAFLLRYAREVLGPELFRAQGPRYPSRMNAVLRSFMEQIRVDSRRRMG